MTSQQLKDFLIGRYSPRWRDHPVLSLVVAALYVGLGIFVNLTIKWWPKVDIPLPFSGDPAVQFPLFWGTVFVGLIFVLRDYGQRLFGDYVIALTLLASIATYIFIDGDVAIYSAAAFLVSEALDQALFHWFGLTKLRDRILWSSLCSVWLDGLIILYGISHLTPLNFASHWTGKMLASIAIWFVLVLLERRSQAAQLNPAE
ncbi:hypothetical protein [Methylobacterium sp. NFXW15]|uniref:hypothetical protein n=1 Tax=Methylobacterium sp. NFXW15 TaxID=2819512 RepID=UPI003CF7FB70